MDTTAVDKRIAELRADDDQLRSHLTQLDEKLTIFIAAIRDGQANLRATRARADVAAPPAPVAEATTSTNETQRSVASRGMFAGGAPPKAEPAAEMPRSEVPEEPAVSAEDEALLAGLDPKAANAIRVKRRLTGYRKSVRELLEEMQETGAGDSANTANKGKKWWRRGNE